MKQINRQQIMSTANQLAKVMSRSKALKRAWQIARDGGRIEALDLTPMYFRPDDRILISLDSFTGQSAWYTFSHHDRMWNPEEHGCFDTGIERVIANFGTIDFVLPTADSYVVERAIA